MSKIYSGIMGLVAGDALGVPVEFNRRDSFHVTDMIGYGTYDLPPGTWSDDSSMTLATVESIGRLGRISTDDIMQNFYRWTDENAFTPYGELFDIGRATREAILRYAWGTPARKCGCKAEWDNGNGSLMRILPLAFTDCRYQMVNAVSSLTHAHEISLEACRIYISVARKLLRGKPLDEIVKTIKPELPVYGRLPKLDTLQRDEIKSSGYVVDTLEAALWCNLKSNSYRECVLMAVNLGEDTDTVGAIAGGLAGISYGIGGEQGIPEEWINQIARKEWIAELCEKFEQSLQKSFKTYKENTAMKDELLKPWNAEQWLSAFGKAESDTHMLHALRKQVYEYTVQAAMQGSYEIIKTDPETNAKQIKTVSLALDPDIAKKTKMYRYEQQPAIQKRYDKTEYKVLSQDCLATAKAFVEQNEGKVAVLNLASRSNPGGGVHWGAGAQEEYCFRCSDYFRSLYQYKDYGPDYGVERSGESYPMDRNFGGVYSPNVTIFRGTEAEGYPFLEKPWKVNFIAVAGINNPDTMTGKDGRKWMTPPMVAITRNKLRTILNIAIDNEVDILVLGAIGCGAFHNPPHHVAHLFKEIFAEPAYAHAFKKVVFAIKKDHNSRKTELARIFEEIIERKEYDLIERPDPSKEFLQYRHQAMVRLNDKFKKLYGLAHDEQADFRWIKTDLTSPDFEDFAFAYRQQIFSVIVEQANVEKDGKFAFGNPGRVAMLRQICYENNLIPCIYPIIKKDGANVFLGIWNLVHAETREFVDPTSLSSDEPVEVSGWEFRNWAIQIVINYIKEQGFQLLSYCDMPGIDPQIWFKNAEGNNCWIEVLPITPGNKPTFSLEGFPSSVLKYDGYVAEVSFAASENDRVSKIFRAKGADVEFEGIKKIHDKNQG